MSKTTLRHLQALLDHIVYYNSITPFPVYDTDWVEDVKNKIKEMEENKDHNYDKDSVVACKYCKSLHIITDEYNNDHCGRCGSVNDLEEFENIYKYQKSINKENK